MTLLHLDYSVVVPQPDPVAVPMAFGVAPGSRDLADAVDERRVDRLRDQRGARTARHDYWVLGQGARDEKPRWSILRDVLGWRR